MQQNKRNGLKLNDQTIVIKITQQKCEIQMKILKMNLTRLRNPNYTKLLPTKQKYISNYKMIIRKRNEKSQLQAQTKKLNLNQIGKMHKTIHKKYKIYTNENIYLQLNGYQRGRGKEVSSKLSEMVGFFCV